MLTSVIVGNKNVPDYRMHKDNILFQFLFLTVEKEAGRKNNVMNSNFRQNIVFVISVIICEFSFSTVNVLLNLI